MRRTHPRSPPTTTSKSSSCMHVMPTRLTWTPTAKRGPIPSRRTGRTATTLWAAKRLSSVVARTPSSQSRKPSVSSF